MSDAEQTYRQAQIRLHDVEARTRNHVNLKRPEFEQRLFEEVNLLFGDETRAAREALRIAKEELEFEKELIAITRHHEIPLGTIMVEWELPRYGAREVKDRKLTGRRGVIEVITKDSIHAGNLSDYSTANRGDLVLRFLKKDGTPSAKYLKCTDWKFAHRWMPEGADLLTWRVEA